MIARCGDRCHADCFKITTMVAQPRYDVLFCTYAYPTPYDRDTQICPFSAWARRGWARRAGGNQRWDEVAASAVEEEARER